MGHGGTTGTTAARRRRFERVIRNADTDTGASDAVPELLKPVVGDTGDTAREALEAGGRL